MTIPKNRKPITAGEVLRQDFVEPLGLRQEDLARALGVHRTTVNELLNGKRAVTSEMALRLSHAFRTSAEYWLNLQRNVDLYDAVNSDANKEIQRLPVLISAAHAET